jgi:hypothetical protein
MNKSLADTRNLSDLKKLACFCGLLLSGLVFWHLFQWESASPFESAIVTIIIILASIALGFLFGYIRPELSFRWGILVTIPAYSLLVFPLVLMLVYFMVSFWNFTIIEAIYFFNWLLGSVIASIFSACIGARLGALLKLKRVTKAN